VTKAGFNLVGNPYPSYLDWTKVAAANTNVSSTVWLRTKSATEYVFATINVESYLTNNNNPPIITSNSATTTITKWIPPMQAYWVLLNASQLTTDYTVTNAMRDHADVNTQGNILKAPRLLAVNKLLRLQVSNGVNSDETLLYFNTNASDDFDRYDSPKMSNNNVAIPEIYTQVGTEKLVINGMNEMTPTTEVKLGFSTGTTNNFTLKATELSNIQDTKIILIDKQNPTVEFDLTDGSVYNFSSNVTNDLTRFSILFRTIGASTGINTIEKLNAQVYVNAANHITIIAPEKSSYSIYNAIGMLLENGTVKYKGLFLFLRCYEK
jgi:hypothetical protein